MAERIVADRYELLEPVGSGGSATVWRTLDRSTDRVVALKLLERHPADDEGSRERVLATLRAASGLSHPNVVAVHDFGVEDGALWIVTELVEGAGLDAVLGRGPVPVARSARMARGVLAGLIHMHAADIVHGDLKPSNMIVAGEDDLRVTDAGLSTALGEHGGRPAADPRYAAPEVHQGGPPTPLSDVYSLGCVLYEMLVGFPPYRAESPEELAREHRVGEVPSVREHRADVGAGYEAIVARAMAKDPADRFPSAKHMDAAIEELGLDHDHDTAPAVVRHRSTERVGVADEPPRRLVPDLDRTLLWAVLGVTAALVIALLAVVATNREPAPTPIPTPVVTPAPQPIIVPPPPPPPPVVEQPTPIVVTPEPTPEEEIP